MTFQLAVVPALMGLTAFTMYRYTKPTTSKNKFHQSIDIDRCRSIIAAEKHPNGLANHLTPYESRALPNERLQIAFGIKNAFTGMDEEYAKRFANHAKDLVNLSSTEEWNELSGSLRDAVKMWTDDQEQIRLTSMIQALSLRMILPVFFKNRLFYAEADAPFVDLAEAINRVWMETKNKDDILRFEDNVELQECLATIFPDSNFSDPEDNPLNLILPGFETMWRVVFRLTLEITFTTGQKHPEWADMLIAFANNPTTAQFTEIHPDNKSHISISPKHLVNEALRLYPPTRRVYRAFKTSQNATIETLSADIEACHTSVDIWGSDAMIFSPGRWTERTSQQRQAFLPFGSGPFVCPARLAFGPRVIGLLVGCLVKGLRRGEWRVEGNGVNVGLSGGRLSNERGAYHDMYLVKVD
ncbi:uncharacterized protein ACHE_70613A [Aspergillus chevalieri]|uniref:Cytochrome P450 n=1 Tax=Aspergillus chevalieri TaxID=182096 RepID=A0A7R7VVX0_ASPCH|nr:uncharacterized protein ACHE_70613A [Aspergillus chevalieri]BCR91770.1 hypothetical protein ACHE_70613A [Aspergillus chevalieri]